MLDALRIIIRHGSIVLFTILQIFCFYWIIKYNQKQSQIYFYSTQVYSNSIHSKFQNLVSYFHLREQNDSLANENAQLIQRYLGSNKNQFVDSSSSSIDTNRYHVIASRIVNNSIAKRNNTLTLDKGIDDGIAQGMGVVSANGVIGIVTDVSKHYSLVMSLLHSKSRISCKISHCGFFGTLVWNGIDPMILQLEDIQRYAEVRVGDSIYTSGFSIVFPENILIGKIKEFKVEPGAFTYSIQVDPSQSFLKLNQVYVINHKLKEEKENLEMKSDKYE
ncbi:MAG: rod shape-determining protein MreC [Saprospiraceae bacterium]